MDKIREIHINGNICGNMFPPIPTTLRGLNFTGNKFHGFRGFRGFLAKQNN